MTESPEDVFRDADVKGIQLTDEEREDLQHISEWGDEVAPLARAILYLDQQYTD